MQLSRQIMQLATEVQEGDHAVRCARWTLERESESSSSGVLSALIWPACRDLGWRVFPLLNGPLTASRCGVGCTDRDSYVTTTDEADEKTRRGVRPAAGLARGGGDRGTAPLPRASRPSTGSGRFEGRSLVAYMARIGGIMECDALLHSKAINNNCTNAWVRRQAAPLGLQMYMREGVSSPRPSTNARLLSWRASRRGSGPPSRPLSCHAAERFQVRRLLTGAFTGAATGRPVLQDLHRAHCAHRANAE